MECGFCKNLYKTPQVLKHHQATSKKCIAIQTQMNHIIEKEHYVCMSCKKELSTKNRLSTHILVCKKIKEDSKVEATESINETLKKLKVELDKIKRDLQLKDTQINELKKELDKTNLKLNEKRWYD